MFVFAKNNLNLTFSTIVVSSRVVYSVEYQFNHMYLGVLPQPVNHILFVAVSLRELVSRLSVSGCLSPDACRGQRTKHTSGVSASCLCLHKLKSPTCVRRTETINKNQ